MLRSRFGFSCKIIKGQCILLPTRILNVNKKKAARSNLEGEVRCLAVTFDVIQQRHTVTSNAICIANERYGIFTTPSTNDAAGIIYSCFLGNSCVFYFTSLSL
jgi:hypothetical protein